MSDETFGVAAPPPPKPGRRSLVLTLGGAALLLAAGILFVSIKLPKWLAETGGSRPAASGSAATGDARKIQATLFYVSADGTELVGSAHDALYGSTPAEQARRIVEAQVQTPPAGRHSAIPPGTTVRTVYMDETGIVYVDLGGSIATGIGGSLDEALAVYAIVNAVTSNLPHVTAVQLLVDGKEVDTLAGHMDLRDPLAKAPEWIRKGQ